MPDKPYRVRAIHYADGEIEDLDALRREAAATGAWRRSAGNAERLIERIKSGELVWDGTQWTAPPTPGLVDHTDPEQIRRAAGVIEGIGVDSGVIQPDERGVAQMVVRDFAVLARRGQLHLPNWRFLGGERGPVTWFYPTIDLIRAELGGHDLACWCPLDQPCHADVLLELANGGGSDVG